MSPYVIISDVLYILYMLNKGEKITVFMAVLAGVENTVLCYDI